MKLTTTIKQQFIHFLKQNNIYEQYMYNFKNKNTIEINFIKFINNTEEIDYIYQAFPWYKTIGGIQKWSELSKKWVNEVYWKNVNLSIRIN